MDANGTLLQNVHDGLALPEDGASVSMVTGTYEYYHYGCDGFDDRVKKLILYFLSCGFH